MEATDVLNGIVDMRTYGRRYLTIYAAPPARSGGLSAMSAVAHPDGFGVFETVTTCVEWLDEHFDFEVAAVFNRQVGAGYICYAMLRRRADQLVGDENKV
ncbi:hypothetical protein [Nocardia callitridis]|uniref:Uncharacterized protein n=1 Tax=Nocardia callitridis TaxID=648753 RepID=A0ABP9L4P7_9NOCA